MSFLYRMRGWILALMAIAMLAIPGKTLSEIWVAEWICFGVLLALGVFLRVLARRMIGDHTRGHSHDATALVTEGVYSKIRHPLYVSNTGIGIAFVVLHFGFLPASLWFAFVLVCFECLLSRAEDVYLKNRFGEEWVKWSQKTPSFFNVSLLVPVKDLQYRRSFFTSVRSDISTWFWLMVCIALILMRKYF